MALYVDASALVSLIVSEPDTRWAQDLILPGPEDRIVSDFGAAEVASAISKRVRMQWIGADAAHDLLIRFDAWAAADMLFLETTSSEIIEAARLVRRFELKVRTPDALHLALARRHGAKLVTRDCGMARAAEMIGLSIATPA